jgi:hypothetical protein
MIYVNIAWRTFAALESAVLVAALAWDWADVTTFKVNLGKLAFLSLAPLVGAVGAAIYAWRNTPASTAVGKALRAAVEKAGAGVGLLVINNWADVFALPNLLVPIVIATVLSFVITLLSYQGQPPVPDVT